jgi:hypothetical protein
MLNSSPVLSQTLLKEHYDFLSAQEQSPKEYMLSLYENSAAGCFCAVEGLPQSLAPLLTSSLGHPKIGFK